jgi:hypothetical protein
LGSPVICSDCEERHHEERWALEQKLRKERAEEKKRRREADEAIIRLSSQVGALIEAARESRASNPVRERPTSQVVDPIDRFLAISANGCGLCRVYRRAVEVIMSERSDGAEMEEKLKGGITVTDVYLQMKKSKSAFERMRRDHHRQAGHQWPDPDRLRLALSLGAHETGQVSLQA